VLSGHLDSKSGIKRNQDWYRILRGVTPEISSWEELCAVSADLRLHGFDMNTRNRVVGDQRQDVWDDPRDIETQLFQQCSLGTPLEFTGASTYLKAHGKASKKGGIGDLSDSGSLDFALLGGAVVASKEKRHEGFTLGKEEGEKRDHHVIVSPVHRLDKPLSEFERVKRYIVERLQKMAPQLADQIKLLTEGKEGKAALVQVYQSVFNRHGLLDRAVMIHQLRMECMQTLPKSLVSGLTSEEAIVFKTALWKNISPDRWFDRMQIKDLESYPERLAAVAYLTAELRKSLKSCTSLDKARALTVEYQAKVGKALLGECLEQHPVNNLMQKLTKSIELADKKLASGDVSLVARTQRDFLTHINVMIMQGAVATERDCGLLSELIDCTQGLADPITYPNAAEKMQAIAVELTNKHSSLWLRVKAFVSAFCDAILLKNDKDLGTIHTASQVGATQATTATVFAAFKAHYAHQLGLQHGSAARDMVVVDSGDVPEPESEPAASSTL
jgi:hypothetical protein